MPQKYYNTKEAAAQLGLSEEVVRSMIDRRELFGYRDGADWKFKVEDIDKMAAERKPAQSRPRIEDSSDEVLLSEIELGQSSVGSSGTVIGMAATPAKGDSGIVLADNDLGLIDETVATPPPIKKSLSQPAEPIEELELSLGDEEITVGQSSVVLGKKMVSDKDSPTGIGSDIALDAVKPMAASDDDMVIGGPPTGAGSGFKLSGDSGISLVDPADSGLSLEEPLDLGSSGVQSGVRLGEEDEMFSLQDSTKSKQQTGKKSADDFLLTPMEESVAEESDSGSQVIALDTDGENAPTMLQGMQPFGMIGDSGEQPIDMSGGSPLGTSPIGGAGMQQSAMAEGVQVGASTWSEAPYSRLNMAGLISCVVLLMLCGMILFDVIRNMWTFDGAFIGNRWLSDFILSWF